MPTKRYPPTIADKPAQRMRFELVIFIFFPLALLSGQGTLTGDQVWQGVRLWCPRHRTRE